MANRSRGQHIVPQMYLRAWLNDDGELYAADVSSGKGFATGTAALAKRNDYFTFEMTDVGPSDEWEKFMGSEIEGPTAPVLQKVLDGVWPLNVDDRGMLANFVALQSARAPWLRKMMNDTTSAMMSMRGQMIASDEPTLRRVVVESLGREPTVEELDVWRETLRSEIAVKHHNNDTLLFFQAASECLQPVADMRWTLLVPDEGAGEFITSDQRIVCWPFPGQAEWMGNGLLFAERVTLPLGPQRCLSMQFVFTEKDGKPVLDDLSDDTGVVSADGVEGINAMTMRHADRHVFLRFDPQ